MTKPRPCPPAPGPLEAFAAQFDDLFSSVAQRRGFRVYLQGLLLPRDRTKTLTGLVGAEPSVQAQNASVQQLQWFLSESTWDAEQLNQRRLTVLCADAKTTPTADGVLIIDDSGDRKSGSKTAHVGRQYLGSVGKIENGVVVVTSVWANNERYYPLHLTPYTPAARLAKGKRDAGFKTKPQIARALVDQAREAGIPFRAIVADSFYGDNLAFEEALHTTGAPYVLAVKPSKGHWAPLDAAHTPREAAERLHWQSENAPGDWTPVPRHFRDGHTEVWWAVDLVFAHYGPERARRLVVVTPDPHTLPDISTWYLVTNLPLPGSAPVQQQRLPAADLAEITRLYGLRNWVEQSYKQQKDQLGWADFMVRTDRAMRRHWQLVVCAFTFCWQQAPPPVPAACDAVSPSSGQAGRHDASTAPSGGKSAHRRGAPAPSRQLLARRLAGRAQLARPVVAAPAPVVQLDDGAPTGRTPLPAGSAGTWRARLPLPPPITTKYR
jgi:hypothetical protein